MTDTPTPEAKPPVDPTISAIVNDAGADLDAVLSEFEREVPSTPANPPAREAAEPREQPTDQRETQIQNALANLKPSFQLPKPPSLEQLERAEQQHWQSGVEQWASGIERERQQERDARDAQAIMQAANAAVAEFENLSPDFVSMWMRSTYDLDRGLRDAVENRYRSHEHMAAAARAVDRTIAKLASAAKLEADRIASIPESFDREAVSAAVRGASTKPPPRRDRLIGCRVTRNLMRPSNETLDFVR